MQAPEYENIYKNEASHFFYVSNHAIILSLVKKYLDVPRSKAKILDAGCGTGLLGKKLQRYGEVQGVDINPQAVKFAKKRGLKSQQATVNRLPFPKNTFDLVVSMDVLYHIQVDDVKALKEFYRILKTGGFVIIRVPAYKWLHLKHDRHVHTRERYSLEEIRNKIQRAGFSTKKVSYVNMALLPLAIVKQFVETITSKKEVSSGVDSENKLVNDILLSFLSIEPKIIPYLNLPFGLGIVAVGQKAT